VDLTTVRAEEKTGATAMRRPESRRTSKLAARRYLIAALLLLPALALRLFTTVYPFFQTLYLSTTNYNPMFPPAKAIGLDNFARIVKDVGVRSSVGFTIVFVLVSTLFQVVLGIGVASLLNANFRGRRFVRAVNLVPWAIPMVVAAIGFSWMYDREYGIISDLFARVTGLHVAWLSGYYTAKVAVIATNVWKSTPFLALVFLAALQGVPLELYEAARVDGAHAWQTFTRITLPLILPQATTMGLFMVVWQLASFDLIYTMTGGGPAYATSVLAYNIYQAAFGGLNFGYASAISMVLFAVVFVVGGLGLLLYRRVEVNY
jgi:multiple sugar transport system permease protein